MLLTLAAELDALMSGEAHTNIQTYTFCKSKRHPFENHSNLNIKKTRDILLKINSALFCVAPPQELDALMSGEASAGSHYLAAIAEVPPAEHPTDAPGTSGKGAGAKRKAAGAGDYADDAVGAGAGVVGILAVETSTGDVLHGACRSGLVQSQLEAALMTLRPSELLAVPPLSAATERVLAAYLAATPGCR